MQSLFEWDFIKRPDVPSKQILLRNIAEFAPGVSDASFMEDLMLGVQDKQKDLDAIIRKAAPDWPIEKISIVDRNILRIGLYELLFADHTEVPPKVAINEAIELAKSFGGDTSGKFVNGVLGAVYKGMGEPGKDELSPKKKFSKDIPDHELPVKNLGGAIVYARHDGKLSLAFVHDVFGHWTLSKGKLEDGEDVKDGTMREIKEEIGLTVRLEDDLGSNEYIAFHPEDGKIKKKVHYFLARSEYVPVVLESSGGLNDARWFDVGDIADLNFYDDILPLVTKAVTLLSQNVDARS